MYGKTKWGCLTTLVLDLSGLQVLATDYGGVRVIVDVQKSEADGHIDAVDY